MLARERKSKDWAAPLLAAGGEWPQISRFAHCNPRNSADEESESVGWRKLEATAKAASGLAPNSAA